MSITLQIPADWGDGIAINGWRYYGFAPGYTADVSIGWSKANVGFSSFAANYAKVVRGRVLKADAHAVVTSHAATVASAPALEIVAHRRGQVEVEPGHYASTEITLYIYTFERRDHDYFLQYTTSSKWLAKEKPLIEASVGSVRFTPTA